MNLERLKEIVDFYYNKRNGELPKDIQVLITLKDPSIGGRAYSTIENISMGFDWEAGELRIEPQKHLFTDGNKLSDVKTVIQKEFNNRKYYVCPTCFQKITKADYFCRYCSQKLKDKGVL